MRKRQGMREVATPMLTCSALSTCCSLPASDLRYDGLHFNGKGYKLAADMVMQALQLADRYLQGPAWSVISPSDAPGQLTQACSSSNAENGTTACQTNLPEPMLPGNYTPQTKLCAAKRRLLMLAESNVGWVYSADDTGWWTLSTLPSSWRTCAHKCTWALQRSPASLGPLKLPLTCMAAMNVTQAPYRCLCFKTRCLVNTSSSSSG